MAAVGRAVLGGLAVLPRLRAGEVCIAVHPGLAVLLRRCPGARRHVVDRDPGRGPARARGRRDRGHRLPAQGGGRTVIAAGQWAPGDPDITIVVDAGCDVTRLSWVLRDLPVELVGRIRSDRVMRLPKPPRTHGVNGRPPKHAPDFRFAKPKTWPEPAITTATDTVNYGKAEAQAWDRVHLSLTHRSAWLEHDGELPIVEGTLVRLKVGHLSKEREAPPVWLWSSKTGAAPATWTCAGRCSSGDSIWSTRFASGDRRPAGPPRGSVLPRQRSAGPGSWSSPTPSSASPGRSPQTSAGLGRSRPSPNASPRPGSAEGSGTSAPTCSARPVFLNRPEPGPDHPRLEEPATRHPLRRRQNRQTPRDPQSHRQTRQILVDKEQA